MMYLPGRVVPKTKLREQARLDQGSANFNAVWMIHVEHIERRPPRRGFSDDERPVPLEMHTPFLTAWIEQARKFSRPGVVPSDVRSLVLIAEGTIVTHEVNRYRPITGFPVVSVSAFLKLADWYRAYRSTTHGGQPCPAKKPEPFSGEADPTAADKPDQALGSSSRGDSPANAATLSRIAAQQIQPPPNDKEVTHEDC